MNSRARSVNREVFHACSVHFRIYSFQSPAVRAFYPAAGNIAVAGRSANGLFGQGQRSDRPYGPVQGRPGHSGAGQYRPSVERICLCRAGRAPCSPVPAQPNEPSTDLFLHDLVTGQTRKLHDNVTEPLPDGSYLFASPQFSRASDNGQRVAFVNLLASSNDQQQGGAYRQLLVLRGSDGFLLSSAEIGNGSMYDFYNSEFVGISWVPGSDQFVTPAYVDVVDNTGRPTAAAGLVMFARDSTGEYRRTGTLTLPQVFSDGLNVIVQTHAWPSFSPDGSLLAFFRMTYPSAVMDQPVETELLMIDASGSGWVMASFNPGVIGMGVSWSANGQQLVFSVAEQSYSNGLFPPTGEPHTAEVFTLDLSSNEFGRVPGVTSGFFPNGGGAAGGGGGETIFRSNFERQ